MKRAAACTACLCLLLVGCAPAGDEPEPVAAAFPELRGPYLGQEPPGLEPRLFAPGVVSTGLATRDLTMTPDGHEIYFSVSVGAANVIMVTRQIDGRWTEPEVAPFSGRFLDIEPAISPDGQRFFFLSTRPQADQEPREGWVYQDIWVMDREGGGWGEPTNLGPPVNTEAPEYYPSVTADGSLYFTREGADGVSATYRSRLVDGAYGEPELMPPQLNCGTNRANVFVAPDESFAIVPTMGRKDGLGGFDYFVTFRSADDRWSEPVNLGPAVNRPEGREWSASLSPDGRYLFFMSSRQTSSAAVVLAGRTITELLTASLEPGQGASAIWWVSSEVIAALRPN